VRLRGHADKASMNEAAFQYFRKYCNQMPAERGDVSIAFPDALSKSNFLCLGKKREPTDFFQILFNGLFDANLGLFFLHNRYLLVLNSPFCSFFYFLFIIFFNQSCHF